MSVICRLLQEQHNKELEYQDFQWGYSQELQKLREHDDEHHLARDRQGLQNWEEEREFYLKEIRWIEENLRSLEEELDDLEYRMENMRSRPVLLIFKNLENS